MVCQGPCGDNLRFYAGGGFDGLWQHGSLWTIIINKSPVPNNMSGQFFPAFPAEELAEQSSRLVQIDGQDILVCNAMGEFFAVANQCPHALSPLAGGRIRRKMISCPLHGMLFELGTGKPRGNLTQVPLTTFPVRVVDGMVEVELGDTDI